MQGLLYTLSATLERCLWQNQCNIGGAKKSSAITTISPQLRESIKRSVASEFQRAERADRYGRSEDSIVMLRAHCGPGTKFNIEQ
jgi:hypothetical protein